MILKLFGGILLNSVKVLRQILTPDVCTHNIPGISINTILIHDPILTFEVILIFEVLFIFKVIFIFQVVLIFQVFFIFVVVFFWLCMMHDEKWIQLTPAAFLSWTTLLNIKIVQMRIQFHLKTLSSWILNVVPSSTTLIPPLGEQRMY